VPKRKLIIAGIMIIVAGLVFNTLPQARVLRAMVQSTAGFNQVSAGIYVQSSSPLVMPL